MQEISVELKVLIVRAGKTSKDISKATRISEASISKILNAKRVPAWNEVYAIAAACGYEVKAVFDIMPKKDDSLIARIAQRIKP